MRGGKDGFMFYRSFMEAADMLEGQGKAALLDAIIRYGLDKAEPSLQGEAEKVAWVLIRPILETNWQRYENGCKGGAPSGNGNARKQPKTTENNQNQAKTNNAIKNNIKDKDKDIKEFIVTEGHTINDDYNIKEGDMRAASLPVAAHAPTKEAVTEYAASMEIAVDEAESFFSYYQACGWKTKKGEPVTDWRRLLATWMKNQRGKSKRGNKEYDPNVGVNYQNSNKPNGKDDLLW